MKKHLLTLLVLSGIAACGTTTQNDSGISSPKPSKATTLKPLALPKVAKESSLDRGWKQNIGKSFSADNKGFQLSLSENQIFAASESGQVKVFDQETGKVVWSTKLKDRLSAGTGLGDGNVYVATDDGEVVALNKATGDEAWRFQASSEVLSAPVSRLGVVVARSSDGRVTGLDSDTGEVKWVVQRDLPKLSLRGDSQTLLFENVAVIGLPSGTLLAIELSTGNVLWDLPVTIPSGSNVLEQLNDIYASPVISGDTLITSTYQGEIVAINIPNRRRVWNTPLSTYHRLAADTQHVYVTDETSTIIALDLTTGLKVWENTDFLRRGLSGAKTIGTSLMVFDNSGEAFSLDSATGAIVSSLKINKGAMIGSPISLGTGFAMLSQNGQITSYKGL